MKNAILATLLTLSSLPAWANLHLAPPDFSLGSTRVVFVDFSTAQYKLNFDTRGRVATVSSEIRFKVANPGRPVFDLIPNPKNVKINGKATSAGTVKMPNGSTVRVLGADLAEGEHVLTLEHELDTNVAWYSGSVRSAFWIRDLRERLFLEQYVPSNLEFDQYAITMDVQVTGRTTARQEIMANGKVSKLNNTTWRIEYPAWYTVSCPYFHTFAPGAFNVRRFDVTSVDGRKVPFTVYASGPSSNSKKYADEAVRVFKELEGDYGAWPHQWFIAYGSGSGGMEHAGATMSSFGALDHEMLHSYYAKGVLPSNGNSGWIDEGIARWRDRGYPRLSNEGGVANLAGRSVYDRNTDNRAYAVGSDLWGHIDHLLASSGGFKPFLRAYFQANKHTAITVEHFRRNLEFFSGMDFQVLFKDHVYRDPTKGLEKSAPAGDDHNHPALTPAQLRALL